MPNYRRARTPGGTYFFTVVTYRRQAIFVEPESRTLLQDAITVVQQHHPFTIDAWVLLPDHLHAIWTLPPGDDDYSKRWGRIKARFSQKAKHLFYREEWMNPAKTRRRESTIWQRRYWEHRIRDDDDFRTHMDYLHYNPVKHGLVERVADWPYSTFHRYVRQGWYPEDWGGQTVTLTETFGES